MESGTQPTQEALFPVSPVAEARDVRLDRNMDPTALCIGCGHVRWRHAYDENHVLLCTAPCPCRLPSASSFIVAEYWDNPHTDGKKHK